MGLRADRGALGEDELTCLESAWQLTSSAAAREPFHDLLVRNAAEGRDWPRWRALAIRQLEVNGAPALVCADHDMLRARASVGMLAPAEVSCLEHTVGGSLFRDTRTDASRLLIANSRRHFDVGTWHGLVHQHLRSVEPGDLDVAFDYQDSLSATDPGVAEGVLAWAEGALPSSLGGEDTRGVMVIRGMADLARIDHAQRVAEQAGTGLAAAEFEMTKADARRRMAEWVDFDTGLGNDPSTSMGACLIAGGNDCCDKVGLQDHPACYWRGYSSSDSPLDERAWACTGGTDPQQLALVGRLQEGRTCLEQSMAISTRGTSEQIHLSRVLMTDARATGDINRWRSTVERHLEFVDEADGLVAYEYARYLSGQAGHDPHRVLDLVAVAMKSPQLRGSAAASRKLYELHRIRTQAGYALWSDAERMVRDDADFYKRRYASQTRDDAAKYASAWHRYATATELDAEEARVICEAAMGGECR